MTMLTPLTEHMSRTNLFNNLMNIVFSHEPEYLLNVPENENGIILFIFMLHE